MYIFTFSVVQKVNNIFYRYIIATALNLAATISGIYPVLMKKTYLTQTNRVQNADHRYSQFLDLARHLVR